MDMKVLDTCLLALYLQIILTFANCNSILFLISHVTNTRRELWGVVGEWKGGREGKGEGKKLPAVQALVKELEEEEEEESASGRAQRWSLRE